MRTIRDTPDLSPVYLVKWEHWNQVLKGKLKGLTGNIKQYNEKEQPVRPEAEYYPVTWRKGGQVIHEVQARYYQYEDEEEAWSSANRTLRRNRSGFFSP